MPKSRAQIRREINRFIGYFRSQVSLVDALTVRRRIRYVPSANEITIHRKVLYLAIFDALAAIRYPTHRAGKTKQRFLQILTDHADWPERDWVSVPVLSERLRVRKLDTSLRRKLLKRLLRYNKKQGNSLPISAFDDVLNSIAALSADPKTADVIRKTTHAELFYRYRNFVMHEFREPGYAMETFGQRLSEPRYHSYIGDRGWHLLYPEAFFRRIVLSVINSLESHYLSALVTPYDQVTDTTAWVVT